MAIDLERWMKSGKYLPSIMRDFHDQKDIFKTLHGIINVEGHDYAKEISWVAGQCYVIDIFLWFMARRGYTLQRSRQRLAYRDLQGDVAAYREKSALAFAAIIESAKAAPPPQRSEDAGE
jgi:hypothetical protein